MNLYQKYRPKIFDEIYGHDKIIKELKKRAKKDIFPYCSCFSGNSGCGKTTFFRIMAKTILCVNKNENNDPCNKCPVCIVVNEEIPSRFYYEHNCYNVNIEEVRTIEQIASTKSIGGTKKVIVLDELQALYSNQKARRTLLKILEKPLKNTYFLLGTMDESKIDKALLNRSVHYKLKDLDFQDISKYLNYICEQENVKINDEKAEILLTIAENSEGSMRTAVSHLERCVFGEIWEKDELIKQLDLMPNEDVIDLLNKILKGDINYSSYEISDKIMEELKFRLNLLYRYKNKMKLNRWESSRLRGCDTKIDNLIIENTIKNLFDLQKFEYISKTLLDFTLLKTVVENAKK